MTRQDPACDLCGDNSAPRALHARCHFTAPLRAILADGWIELRCYVPSCDRLVARFKVSAVEPK